MAKVAGYLRRRTQWIRETKALTALGIQPPDHESLELLEAAAALSRDPVSLATPAFRGSSIGRAGGC